MAVVTSRFSPVHPSADAGAGGPGIAWISRLRGRGGELCPVEPSVRRRRRATRRASPSPRSGRAPSPDHVGVTDGRQPVRDHEAGTPASQRRHRPLDQHPVVSTGSSPRRGVRITGPTERPRDRDELLLARRQARTPSSMTVRSRPAASERSGRRASRRGLECAHGSVVRAVGDVVRDVPPNSHVSCSTMPIASRSSSRTCRRSRRPARSDRR